MTELEKENETKKEKVMELQKIGFSIAGCPVNVFKDFKEFCNKETNSNYSFGLKLLLDAYKANIKEIVLYEKYMELNERVSIIEDNLLDKGTGKNTSQIKTMGTSKGEKRRKD